MSAPLPLNFRDLGGAPTPDGRVALGRLFRSAQLSDVSAELAEHLQGALGIGAYIDFRTEQETARDGHPAALIERGVLWQRHPFDISDATFEAVAFPGAEDRRALYGRAFERLRREFASAVLLIANADAPLVFGCWAGKDRTGIVAALVLSLLGVGDERIGEDFARTGPNLAGAEHRFSFLWQDKPELKAQIARAAFQTEPETILGFLRDVRRQWGSVSRALKVSEADLLQLRSRYVERAPSLRLSH